MDEQSVVTAYRRLSRQYDRFFGPVFEQGRQEAVQRMDCQAGDRVLEVGVGTGLSLDHYGDGVQVHLIKTLTSSEYSERVIQDIQIENAHGPHHIDVAGAHIAYDYYRNRISALAGIRRLGNKFGRAF